MFLSDLESMARFWRDVPNWCLLSEVLSQQVLNRNAVFEAIGLPRDEIAKYTVPGIVARPQRDDPNRLYSVLDVAAILLAADLERGGQPVEYFSLHPHRAPLAEFMWQALPAVAFGKSTFFGTDFKDITALPSWTEEPAATLPDDADGVRYFQMNLPLRRALLANMLRGLRVSETSTGCLLFEFEGKGFLQLETLVFGARGQVFFGDQAVGMKDNTQNGRLHSYKKLTVHNLAEMDPTFVSFSGFGDQSTRDGALRELIDELLSPKLAPEVPNDIHRFFDYLRSMMVYGVFYYPIFTLAADQMWLMVEAAVFYRCVEAGFPEPPSEFIQMVDLLIREGIIPKNQRFLWENKWQIRNDVAHRKGQGIFDPGTALGIVSTLAQDINRLFKSPYSPTAPAWAAPDST